MKTQERKVYGSDPFGYDFEDALANAKTAEPKQGLTIEQLYLREHWPKAPSRDDLIRHAEKFGPEEVQAVADAYGINLDRSPLTEYRRERLALEKRYRDSPTLSARLMKLSRDWLSKVRRELASEILSGALTVPGVAAEFGVRERTVRGWCSA